MKKHLFLFAGILTMICFSSCNNEEVELRFFGEEIAYFVFVNL